MKSRLLFYFNGFNSAIPEDWSDNAKICGVEALAARHGFRFLPRTVNFREARKRADAVLREAATVQGRAGARVIFAGSSMGGWFARVLQLMLAERAPGLRADALAFNPAFDLQLHGHVLVGPQVNQVTGEAYDWTADDSRRLALLEQAVDYDRPLPFFVYVDQADEVIDWRASAARHSGMARFVSWQGGSHLFEHVQEALQDFTTAAALEERPAS